MKLLAVLCLSFVVLVPSRSDAAVILGPFTGDIDGSDPTMNARLSRNGIDSTCAGKAFPGTISTAVGYESFAFFNSGPEECVTVSFLGTTTNFVSAYGNSFDPTNLGLNYLGDAGGSTFNLSSFSFLAPADSPFLVIVNSVGGTTGGDFSFTVSGDTISVGSPAAPEPATLTLLAFGVATAGRGLWRRRQVA